MRDHALRDAHCVMAKRCLERRGSYFGWSSKTEMMQMSLHRPREGASTCILHSRLTLCAGIPPPVTHPSVHAGPPTPPIHAHPAHGSALCSTVRAETIRALAARKGVPAGT